MEIIHQHTHIDYILDSYQDKIDKDFIPYKHHVYRVFNLVYILTDYQISEEKLDKIAIAAAFHDIGIWTHDTFDYLPPSMELAAEYAKKIGLENDIREIQLIIEMHHKQSMYEGSFAETVELFRKADLIDVSMGLFAFKVNHIKLKALEKAFPVKGFHLILMKKAAANFLKNPFNPLPMVKR